MPHNLPQTLPSEHQVRTLFDHLPVGAAHHKMIFDADGVPVDYIFLQVNDAFEKLTGLKREALIGCRVTEVLPQISASDFDWIGTYGRVASTGESTSFEQYAEHLGRWYSVSAYSPGRGYFVTVFQDITEHRKTIEELKSKEQLLQRQNQRQGAFLRISQVIQEMARPDDLETVLCVCLDQLRKIGIRADTMAIHRVVDPAKHEVETYRVDRKGLVQPPHQRRARHLVRVWATRKPYLINEIVGEGRERFRRKFAGLIIASCYDVPFNLGVVSVHSTEPHAFIEVDRDELEQVADLFSVGLARLADLEALSESEREWRQLVENVRDVIITVDLDARIQFINHSAPGRTLEQTIGSDLRDLVAPEDRDRVTRTFEDVINNNKDRQLEVKAIVAGGDYGWYFARISPLIEDDEVVGAHILSYDITDRKKTEQELVRLERLRALGEMTAGISHNLNNILTGILGPAALLRDTTGNPQVKEDASLIHRSASRARDLIHRLDRSIKGSAEHTRAVDPGPVIEDVVQATRPRWHDEPELQGIRIEVHTDLPDVPPIAATESGLHDIVMNLLFNAIDAMPRGGTIHLTTVHDQNEVRVIVQDTGIGMNEETQRRVFEPFFTTKADVGTGLGLSTVYGTISSWGGRVELQSTPDEGTTFTLHLPVWDGEESPPVATETDRAATRRGRVLVVDDEDIGRSVVRAMLDSYHDVEAARGGWEAIELLGKKRFDVALIDLGMPEWTGDRVAKRMKEVDPALTTVLLTGWDPTRSGHATSPLRLPHAEAYHPSYPSSRPRRPGHRVARSTCQRPPIGPLKLARRSAWL